MPSSPTVPNPADTTTRPELRMFSSGEMYEWLRDTAGTGPLAHLFRHARWGLISIPGATDTGFDYQDGSSYYDSGMRVNGITLASMVQASYRCMVLRRGGDGEYAWIPGMFPIVTARRAVGSDLPNCRPVQHVVRSGYDGAPSGYDPESQWFYTNPGQAAAA